MSYVVFLFYGATNLRQDRAKSQVYDVKNKTFINFTFVKGRTLVISNSKRVRDAAFFFIIMLVTFAATLLKPQKYVSSRTIQKCVEHVSTST